MLQTGMQKLHQKLAKSHKIAMKNVKDNYANIELNPDLNFDD